MKHMLISNERYLGLGNKQHDKLLKFFLGNNAELKGFLMKRLRSEQDTEDLLQNLYLRIQKYDGKEEIINTRSFVYRIANNLAIDILRQKKRMMNHYSESNINFPEIASTVPLTDQLVYDRTRLRFLQEALNKLTEKSRRCFILHRCDKMTYQEVGKQVGISESMAKKHVIKALAHCRKYMKRLEET